jgi:hypothetical protein
MSTIKADAVTAVSAGGDLSLDGLGTGGVSIASTLKMTKGGDISSASPLVIDTDGNYFDVTGTTNFSAMTVESGNFFMLQFDGALTITHGSGIELPGAANLTTAAGDRLICYATAADTVEVMSVETEAASSAGFTQLTEAATTSGNSDEISGIPTTASMVVLMFYGVSSSGNIDLEVEMGDSGGFETADYKSTHTTFTGGVIAGPTAIADAIEVTGTAVYGGTGTITGTIIFTKELDSADNWTWFGHVSTTTDTVESSTLAGSKSLSADFSQIKMTSTNTLDAGAINAMYI